MHINSIFPSRFFKASDMGDKNATEIIDRVVLEDVGRNNEADETRPVIYFSGQTKGLVLNKTNANVISEALGPETEDWRGRTIILYSTPVPFQGQTVDAIRVKVPKPPSKGTEQDPKDANIPF